MLKTNDGHIELCGMLDELSKISIYGLKKLTSQLARLEPKIEFKITNNSRSVILSPIKSLSKKFDRAIIEAESMLNKIVRAHFQVSSKSHDYSILDTLSVTKNLEKQDEESVPKIYDIATVDGCIELKLDIKAIRDGYFLLLRNSNDLYSENPNDKYIPQLTCVNNQNYHLYSKMKDENWGVVRLKADSFLRNVFKSVKKDRKVFVSLNDNVDLFDMIQRKLPQNLNCTTKEANDEGFFGLVKFKHEGTFHYASIGIFLITFFV